MKKKISLEILLQKASIRDAGLQKFLLKSRNLLTIDLIWPRNTIAKKTAAREANFTKSKVDFSYEPWTKRVLFREEIDGHCGFAVTISESLNTENLEKFLRLTLRSALRTTASVMDSYTVGMGDIASAPIDALASMAGTYPGPKNIAQGVFDLSEEDMPEAGEEKVIEIPLTVLKPKIKKGKLAGYLSLLIRA